MYEERELISLMLSVFALAFVLAQPRKLKSIPFSGFLTASFITLWMSWAFSFIEGFVWEPFFNFLQHGFSGLSAVLLAVWSGHVLLRKRAVGR